MNITEENAYKLGEKFGKSLAFVIVSIPFTLFMTWSAFNCLDLEWCLDYGFGIWMLLVMLRFFVVDEL